MSTRIQTIGAYLGFGFVLSFFIGFWILAGFIPPPSPASGPAVIAARFAGNTTGIRAGMLVNMLGAALLLPWCAVIACQMKRIETRLGRSTPLTYVQLMCGALVVFELILPCAIWQTAAFRPHASPLSIQRLDDLAWLPFLGILSTAVVQGVCFGVAILIDRRPEPVFPRWAGYFNIWIVMMFFPAGLIFFFKHGPFAWNGLLAWWLIVVAFSLWILVDTIVLIAAVRHEAREDALAVTPSRALDFDALAAEFERFRAAHSTQLSGGNR